MTVIIEQNSKTVIKMKLILPVPFKIKVCVCCLFCVVISVNTLFAQSFIYPHFKIEKLAERVYAAIPTDGYSDCNAGIIDLGDATLIFDTFVTPKAARELKEAAAELLPNPIRFVVNSHWHYDHIRGNQVFSPDALIISTSLTRSKIAKIKIDADLAKAKMKEEIEKTRSRIKTETNDFRRQELADYWLIHFQAQFESFDELRITPPNLTFKERLVLHGSSRDVEIFCYGHGHSDSDTVLYLPNEKIAFLGDLLDSEYHPWMGGCFFEDWIEYLKKLKSLRLKKVVPGHGPVVGLQAIDVMIDYLNLVQDTANKLLKEGKKPEDALGLVAPPPYDLWSCIDYFGLNVSSVLTKLYAKKVPGRTK